MLSQEYSTTTTTTSCCRLSVVMFKLQQLLLLLLYAASASAARGHGQGALLGAARLRRSWAARLQRSVSRLARKCNTVCLRGHAHFDTCGKGQSTGCEGPASRCCTGGRVTAGEAEPRLRLVFRQVAALRRHQALNGLQRMAIRGVDGELEFRLDDAMPQLQALVIPFCSPHEPAAKSACVDDALGRMVKLQQYVRRRYAPEHWAKAPGMWLDQSWRKWPSWEWCAAQLPKRSWLRRIADSGASGDHRATCTHQEQIRAQLQRWEVAARAMGRDEEICAQSLGQ